MGQFVYLLIDAPKGEGFGQGQFELSQEGPPRGKKKERKKQKRKEKGKRAQEAKINEKKIIAHVSFWPRSQVEKRLSPLRQNHG